MIDTSLLYLYVNASDLMRCAASSVPEFRHITTAKGGERGQLDLSDLPRQGGLQP
jgi:hypothetical protein